MEFSAESAARMTPKAASGLEFRAAGGESLVHDPATGQIHVLNATAARVLAACDGRTTLAAIVDDLVASTNVDRERAERDVAAVCADFRAKGLIS